MNNVFSQAFCNLMVEMGLYKTITKESIVEILNKNRVVNGVKSPSNYPPDEINDLLKDYADECLRLFVAAEAGYDVDKRTECIHQLNSLVGGEIIYQVLDISTDFVICDSIDVRGDDALSASVKDNIECAIDSGELKSYTLYDKQVVYETELLRFFFGIVGDSTDVDIYYNVYPVCTIHKHLREKLNRYNNRTGESK